MKVGKFFIVQIVENGKQPSVEPVVVHESALLDYLSSNLLFSNQCIIRIISVFDDVSEITQK